MDKELSYGGTFHTVKAGLSAISGQGTTTYSTTATANFAIEGKAYSKTAVTTGATPTTDANTGAAYVPLAANQGCAFVFGFDASGAIKVAQGPVATLDSAGNFLQAPQLPQVPDSVAAFGYVIIKNGSTGSAWTFGTSLWNATGISASVQDVLILPRRPQVA